MMLSDGLSESLIFDGGWMDEARDRYAFMLAQQAYDAARKVIKDAGCDAGIGLAAATLVAHWFEGSTRAQTLAMNKALSMVKMEQEEQPWRR